MSFWNDTSVLDTGGAGFLGSQVIQKLKNRGFNTIFVPRSRVYNLIRKCIEAKEQGLDEIIVWGTGGGIAGVPVCR